MLIWFLMAIGVIVIVAGGFAGRGYQNRRRSGSRAMSPQSKSHHGKAAKNHRGRGR